MLTTCTKRPPKASSKESREHFLGTDIIIKHATSTKSSTLTTTTTSSGTCTTEAGEGIPGRGAGALEPGLGVGAVAVVALLLLLVAEDGKGLGDHLEGLVGVLVAVLVRVRQQTLLAVGLLDVCVGAGRPHRFQVQDLVEGRHLALPDAQHRRPLLRRALPLLIPLVVLSRSRPRAALAGVGAGGFGAGHSGGCG